MIPRALATWIFCLLVSMVVVGACAAQPVASFDDITFWIGSGESRAALLIDWDGQSSTDESLVWGYRWDGAAEGADMLLDILTFDQRLFAKLSAVAGLGTAVVGLGYDLNRDGQFALSDDSLFDERGITNGTLSDLETSVDPADLYVEGWFLGFWHVAVAAENPFDDGAFVSTSVGVDNIELADNAWLSLAFTTDTTSTSDFAENPIAAESSFSADFDVDQDVDGADLLVWQRGFGIAANASLGQGDANADGRVDGLDLQVWADSFGRVIAGGGIHVVPEPRSFVFAIQFSFSFLLTRFSARRCI